MAQCPDSFDNVIGGEGDVLNAGTAVEFQILLDLGAPAGLGWLVDRKFDPTVAALDHFGHQSGVLGADVLIVEMD